MPEILNTGGSGRIADVTGQDTFTGTGKSDAFPGACKGLTSGF